MIPYLSSYARYLGDKELTGVDRKQDIIEFLDTRRKDTVANPDQKWIRTWNDHLQRIKYSICCLHKHYDTSDPSHLLK